MLIDLGLRDTWISDMMANLTKCDTMKEMLDSHGKGARAFSLEEMASFFFIIFFGLFVSTMVFVYEAIKSKSCCAARSERKSL